MLTMVDDPVCLNEDPCSVDWLCGLSLHISMDTPTEVALATGLAAVALAAVLVLGTCFIAVLIAARGAVSARSLLRLHRGYSHGSTHCGSGSETASTPSAFPVMVGGQLCGLWGWVLVGVAVHHCWELNLFTIVCLYCGIRGAAECCNFSMSAFYGWS